MNIPKEDIITITNLGNLTGTVTELNGGIPVSDAIITVQGTSFSATSSYNGTYEINNIPAGTYTVVCYKSGYNNATVNVTIEESITTTQDFLLEEASAPPNELIGETLYDLQSNAGMQNRIYKYPDGTIGATFTFGMIEPTFPDRRTGYNYFDGSSWNPIPVQGIESDRTGWSSYAPWGTDGEIVVAHYSGAATDGLVISSRSDKGTGDWTEIDFYGPASSAGYLWPRATTGGTDHSDLHVIALTMPEANGGTIYQGMDGALLYSRSADGGQTWDFENVLLDGINSGYYVGFSGDTYEIATQGNNVAFLVGDEWTDLVLLKSTNNGSSWTKTIVWEHPYPFFDPDNPTVTDTFYCVDGAHSLAFDNSGKIHIAFGINRASNDGTASYWFPAVGGIGYWNEDMPTFSNNLNALSPYGDPGSELIQDYNFIGWSQDINGNGQLDILDDWGTYYLGFSSMPQLLIDEMNNVFLVYSSVTETYDNGTQNYRHLWARGSNDNGLTWGDFIDLNSDLIYIFSECVFPSLSPTSDDYLHFIFQKDDEPGMAVKGDEDPYIDNYIEYLNILKTDIIDIQSGGTLEGTVTDAGSGMPVENALITLTEISYTNTTSSNGTYAIYNIPPGDYTAICSKFGYLFDTAQITIESGGTTTQDFELEEASNLEPPLNLWADVDGNSVTLYWEEPPTKDLIGYNVYRNGEIIFFVVNPTYTDENLSPGTYDYFVTAVYDEGESLPSNSIEITIDPPLNPPENLIASVQDNEVLLLWNEPGGGSGNGDWIQWDDGTNTGNGIGLTSGGTFYVASHWLLTDLAPYDGMVITKISFFPNDDPYATFELMAWTGPNANIQIMTQEVESFYVNEFNEVTLTSPILIDASEELWFGYRVTHEINTFPAGCDNGPAIQYSGDMISTDGISWESLYALTGGDLNFNFNLAAFVIETDGSTGPAIPITKSFNNNASNNELASAIEYGVAGDFFKKFSPSESKVLQGYNIYRDNSEIDFTIATAYTDEVISPGSFEYFVTAMYDEGESEPSNVVMVFCTPPPPINLIATVFDENNVHLEWEPPPWGSPSSYNLYKDGNLIGNSTNGSADDLNLQPGTYQYCVTALYENDESDCSNIVSVTIDDIIPPENFAVSVQVNDVLCTWDPIESKDFIGYRIYRNDEDISGLITETEYPDNDLLIGTYVYFVKAEYDGGLSGPSDSVTIVITDIEDNSFNNIQIFPNPAKDFVIIKSGYFIEGIAIFNHTGQKVVEKVVENKYVQLNTSGLKPGLYLFKIETRNDIFSKRIIIE